MALDRTASRANLTYLRRRPKVGETPPPSEEPAAPAGPSLSLGRAPKQAAGPAMPEVRRVSGRTLLTVDTPTATLDRRQSAIGSVSFEIAGPGAVGALWELEDGSVGHVEATVGTTTSPEFGRRPIVELTRGKVVVGLRHVRELRRLLILVSGFRGNDPQRLLMTLHDDSTLESTHVSTSGPVVVALAIYQVGGELVIRREDHGFDSGETAGREYGFIISWLPPVQRA